MELEGFDTISVDGFLAALPEFQTLYRNLSKKIVIQPFILQTPSGTLFEGQTVVFTGFRDDEWAEFIVREGGKITGSVSKNTTLLIYSDGDESSVKYKTAVKLGVKTISKSNFAKKYKLN
jgi:NAD-dependent DNA ligase